MDMGFDPSDDAPLPRRVVKGRIDAGSHLPMVFLPVSHDSRTVNVPFFVNEGQNHTELSATAFRQLGLKRLPGVLMDLGCFTPTHLVTINGLEAYAVERVEGPNDGVSTLGNCYLNKPGSRFEWHVDTDAVATEATLVAMEKEHWDGGKEEPAEPGGGMGYIQWGGMLAGPDAPSVAESMFLLLPPHWKHKSDTPEGCGGDTHGCGMVYLPAGHDGSMCICQ